MSNARRDILVAGLGAIGTTFACLLRAAGHRVTALLRPGSLGPRRERALLVSGIWGEHRALGVRVTDDAARLGDGFDAVLVAVKATQTEDLLRSLGDRAAPAGVAISLQNGLGNVERLAAVYGESRVLAGRVIFGARRVAPGAVEITVEAEPLLIGPLGGGDSARASEWATVFAQAGIACRPTSNILAALWGKVFYNAALNPMGALLGLSYGELAADSRLRAIMDRVIGEAFAVATAERVPLGWLTAEEYLAEFYARLVPSTAGHRSSMLQDLEAGRPTEIDAICGEVCRRGDALGIDVTANRILATLVRARSSH